MTLKYLTSILVLISALALAWDAGAQELTADQVGHDGSGKTFKSKIYMGHGKVRIETQEDAASGSNAFDMPVMILDLASGTVVLLNPNRKTYMDQPPTLARRTIATWKLPDNTPCAKNPNSTGTATCKQIGTETIHGRNAEKWEIVMTMGDQTSTLHVWLDAQWHFIVKQDGLGATGELLNIKEGPQPASLFEVPPDYHKLTAQDRFRN
jgi:Domain of unknown function (DUF4412)